MTPSIPESDLLQLAQKLRVWSASLGFQQLGVTSTRLGFAEDYLQDWLEKDYHGTMDWMQRHGSKRTRPEELVAGTVRIISVRMDYYPGDAESAEAVLQDPSLGYISRYALGRDYHKLMRRRLQQLAEQVRAEIGEFGYRVFVDSAPVMEKPLAQNAGLGWIGKHTNLLNREAGSWFFLGEIYTDLPLPVDPPSDVSHCGSCFACIDACPTDAIVAPYELDARRCISYLTIEHDGVIPEEFRGPMGNRIYGCDDCQLVCPWNRFSTPTREPDFTPRHALDAPELLELFQWDEADFLQNTEGMAIRRIGHRRWLRNIAVALGNAPPSREIVDALRTRRANADEVVAVHIDWALVRQQKSLDSHLRGNDDFVGQQ